MGPTGSQLLPTPRRDGLCLAPSTRVHQPAPSLPGPGELCFPGIPSCHQPETSIALEQEKPPQSAKEEVRPRDFAWDLPTPLERPGSDAKPPDSRPPSSTWACAGMSARSPASKLGGDWPDPHRHPTHSSELPARSWDRVLDLQLRAEAEAGGGQSSWLPWTMWQPAFLPNQEANRDAKLSCIRECPGLLDVGGDNRILEVGTGLGKLPPQPYPVDFQQHLGVPHFLQGPGLLSAPAPSSGAALP